MSIKILALNREVEVVKEMFKDMQNNAPGNLKNFPVFKKDVKHYLDLLDLNMP